MSDAVRLVAAGLQRERARAGWSMGELARRSGVAKSTLSHLEAAQGNPSVETLWALATALGIPFSRLVEPPAPATTLVRAGEGTAYAAEGADYRATLLASSPGAQRDDLFRLDVGAGARRESDPHPAGTVEHLVVCRGQVLAGPVEAPVRLGPGDYLRYPGDAPHVFEAVDGAAVAVLMSAQR